MTDQTYYVSVYQPEDFPLVEVQIRRSPAEMSGYLSVQACWKHPQLLFPIFINVSFRDGVYTAAETRAIANWFSIAAQAIEALQSLIKGPDDLRHQYEAEMAGQTVVIRRVGE